MSQYTLPELSYDYGALAPHISGQIMELHHSKHHAAYVKGTNDALEKLAEARDKEDFATIPGVQRALAFNLSGHVLHSIFWNNLSPDGGDKPVGDLATAIDNDFGGFEKFKAHLNQAATTIMGSGWGILAYEPNGKRLIVEQVYDHQANIGQGSVPLFVVDAWEHAYYLDYKNVKADYMAAIWNIVNWNDVSKRFEEAKKLSLP